MKKKTALKGLLIAAVSGISLVGINSTTQVKQIAGERVVISKFSLATQAQAYCNEAQYPGEVNNGKCSGTSFLPESRCLLATSGENCTGAHTY